MWIKQNTRRFNKEHGRKPQFNDAPEDLVKRRVIWDAESTLLLHQLLKPKINATCPELYKTEHTLILTCIDTEQTGLLIDITRAKQLKQQAEFELQRIQTDLNKLVCPMTITRKKKKKETTEVIESLNPNSSAIHLPAAFQKMGIPLRYRTEPKKKSKGKLGKTGGGNWCFDEYAMIRYVSKPLAGVIKTSSEEGWSVDRYYREVYAVVKKHKLHKRELLPPLILKYRELTKMVSTYYNHLIDDCVDVRILPSGRETGVLHCKFNPAEAMTGRFSVSEPSLQNVPRILGPRECVIPRLGRRNWHSDYEQVEMKFFVHFARDPIMAEAINDDIHLRVASEIYQLPRDKVSSEQRKRAKGTNFGIIYGAGGKKIAETLTRRGLPTTEHEGKVLVAKYHRRFPSVRKTTQALKIELSKKGYITNPFGRRYHIPSQLSYKALNYMCQGTSADLMKRAMADIWLWLRQNNYRSKIIMTIHDEIVLEVPYTEEKYIIPKVKQLMEDLTSFFVPITVDMKIVTKRWSQKVKPKELGLEHLVA